MDRFDSVFEREDEQVVLKQGSAPLHLVVSSELLSDSQASRPAFPSPAGLPTQRMHPAKTAAQLVFFRLTAGFRVHCLASFLTA
jgi:hypothetical protein